MLRNSYPREYGFTKSRSGQVHYWTAGTGPNVLFIHQSGNSSEEFAALVPHLAGDYRMIAVDLPGHGRSFDPDVEPTVEEFADATMTVLDDLNIETAHVVAHHGGGLTAMCLMAAHPNRFGKAILSGVDETVDPVEHQNLVQKIEDTDTTVRADPGFVASAWQRYQSMLSDGAMPHLAIGPFTSFLTARLRPHRGILTNLKWDRRDAVSQLRGPILWVTPEKDHFASSGFSRISIVPRSEHLTLAGAGTFMYYDFSESCAAMIREYLDPSSAEVVSGK